MADGLDWRALAFMKPQVAELVDALDSGSSGSNPVQVQVLSWGPAAQGWFEV
jgi:hypothetical protein